MFYFKFAKAINFGCDENVSLTSTKKKSVVDVVNVNRRPDWAFQLVDVDHPDVLSVDVDQTE